MDTPRARLELKMIKLETGPIYFFFTDTENEVSTNGNAIVLGLVALNDCFAKHRVFLVRVPSLRH